jgi:hypothetical protein
MFKRSITIASLIFLALGLILWASINVTGNNTIEGLHGIQAYLNEISLMLTVFRIVLLMMIYYYWDSICQWYGNIKDLDEELINDLIKSRNTFMMWFFAVEILINQNFIGFVLEKIL